MSYPYANLVDLFFTQAQHYAHKNFLYYKNNNQWQPISWQHAQRQICYLSHYLTEYIADHAQNYPTHYPKRPHIIILAENSPQWVLSDLAIMAADMVAVPIFTTYHHDQLTHVINDAQAQIAIVGNKALYDKLKAADTNKHIQHIIMIDDTTDDGVSIQDIIQNIIHRDKDAPHHQAIINNAKNIAMADMCCMIYTSGTSGKPKGVMLTHRSILCNVMGALPLITELPQFQHGHERFLCFLPLSHAYEHCAGLFVPMVVGAEIYFAESLQMLVPNMAEVKPTVMTAVPRLYESIYQKISTGLKSASTIKQKLMALTLYLGKKAYHGDLSLYEKPLNRLCDILVRRKVKARFGGTLKAFISGGGALHDDLAYFFQAIGLNILQGYGLTETSPVVSCNKISDNRIGSVGAPFPNTDVKIADDGEILVKGDLVMEGYWQLREQTAEIIKDGWLYTGDIGALRDGYLYITDRKKDIIVTAGGDNIAPQKIENTLQIEDAIAQACIFGDRRNYLVALIVKQEGVSDDAVHQAIARCNQHFNNHERIRHYHIIHDAFTIENGMMTPSYKTKRYAILEYYRDIIDGLYH